MPHLRDSLTVAKVGLRAGTREPPSFTQLVLSSSRPYATISAMESGRVLWILRKHQPELNAAGITHLRIFGSVARGEASPQSDIDLLADFASPTRLTLLTVSRLQNRLTDLLGAEVDLSSPGWMRDPARTQALEESIVAF